MGTGVPVNVKTQPDNPQKVVSMHLGAGKGDWHLLCNDHVNMVPAEGPFRQKVPVPFSAKPYSGRRMLNVLPSPTLLSTEIDPWWASAICLAMASPSPVPPNRRLRPGSAR
jgi:hypothetical protein